MPQEFVKKYNKNFAGTGSERDGVATGEKPCYVIDLENLLSLKNY